MLMQGESMGKRLGLGGGALVFRRFGVEGYVQDSRIGSGDDEALLARTVALLGDRGWELISVSAELQPGASFSGARWVFKRPVAEKEEDPEVPAPELEATPASDAQDAPQAKVALGCNDQSIDGANAPQDAGADQGQEPST
jgi:hypothetical protein